MKFQQELKKVKNMVELEIILILIIVNKLFHK